MDFKFNPFTGTFDLVNSASAGTGTSSNTPNTLVLRDGSGNFSAGTITAALTGAASNNVLKAGDIMTGVLQVTSGTASLPGISISGDTDTGLYSPGANQLGFATSGTGRILLDADGNVTIQNQKEIRFADSDSSNYVSFKAPSTVTTNVSWTLPSTDGTTGQLLSTNGAGILSWATATGGGSSTANYQEFTSSGTWTKPAGVTFIYVECVSGGGGGGSGRRGGTGTVRCGGGGGASGKFVSRWMPASLAGSTETVTVGAGGTGGAAVTANDTFGNNGNNGGSSSFGSLIITPATGSGSGGTASSGAGGTLSYYGATTNGQYAATGGNASGTGSSASAGNRCALGAGSGSGGGGILSTNAASNGAVGGQGFAEQKNTAANQSGTSGGGTAGTSGGSGGNGLTFGDGGGGGGASTTADAGAGGNGAFPGGGGGGGGASLNGFNSGAGGDGGGGYVRIWSW